MTGQRLRALSIRQPWLDLILGDRHGGPKTVENRSWGTHWRGILLLHAGKNSDRGAESIARAFGVDPAGRARGGYLGLAELRAVHRDTGCCTAAWGEPGARHWVLGRRERLPEPIPAAGQRGLYTPSEDVLDALAAQAAAAGQDTLLATVSTTRG